MNHQLHLYLLCCCILLSLGCDNSLQKKSPPTKEPTTQPSVEEKTETPKEEISISRFQNEIDQFLKQDEELDIPKNGILMTGSSSIRMWKSMQKDFPKLPVYNRGFGGATIPEVIHFAGQYIFHHQPQIIVFYCGENDISEGASPETVFASFQAFVKIIETKLPETKLVYLSMKPSIARWNLWPKYQAGEELIKAFVEEKSNIEYMDASVTMLDENGEVKKDIFIEDGLHMNAKGYEGWTNQLKPILEQLYQVK